MKVALWILAVFFILHAVRDVLQIKYGYKNWFLRVGHVWHAPQYEKHGIVVSVILGILCFWLALR